MSILKKNEDLNALIIFRSSIIKQLYDLTSQIDKLTIDINNDIHNEFTIDHALIASDIKEDSLCKTASKELLCAGASAVTLAEEKLKEVSKEAPKEILAEDKKTYKLSLVTNTKLIDNTLNNTTVNNTLNNTLWKEQAYKKNTHQIKRQPLTSLESSIQITKTLSLPAITVSSFNDVLKDGKLYYISKNNHFAMYISEILFHGNIGIIYNNERSPLRIKNCQYHNKDWTKVTHCTYYHDPQIYVNSDDVRNYVANSWLYNQNHSTWQNKDDNVKYRHFGNITCLDDDIKNVTPDDITKFRDMVFHDLLCTLLLLG